MILNGGDGAVVFQTHDVAKARTVNGNYPGSVIDPNPDPAPEPAEPAPDGEPVKATEATEAAPADDDTA
ncbi:hypothetical protein [Streptomyces longwoodensis]|uniref:hypothetical protein n=1 Tax=Streptomyces longwoodensis TaxID=68231 RepID=UPI00131ECC5C|nr:hypothetical protein [Streptomyces longwoodensis]